jgi:hypothetical protein
MQIFITYAKNTQIASAHNIKINDKEIQRERSEIR